MRKMTFAFKIQKLLIYIAVFIFVYMSSGIDSSYYSIMKVIMVCILGWFILEEVHYLMTMKQACIYFIAASVFIIINYFNYSNTYLNLIARMINFIAVFIFCIHLQRCNIELGKILEDTVILIAIICAVFFLLINILHLNLPYSMKNGYMCSYYGLYNYVPTSLVNFGSITVHRINGMFTEPGMYAVFLCLGIFQHISNNNDKKWQIILLYINLVFTFSATGIIAGLILLGYMVVKNDRIKDIHIIVPCIPFFFYVAYYIVQSKRIEGKTYDLVNGGSYAARYFDLVNGFKLFLSHPVLGVGYYNFDAFTNLENNYVNRVSSNGMINLLYMTGIIGFLVFFSPFIVNILKSRRRDRIKKLVYLVVIVFLNLSQPITFYPIMSLLIADEYALWIWRKRMAVGGKNMFNIKRGKVSL